jgi:Lrp/AsnC family transcriptional regulator, leucine-responsive regulatory protein
MIKIDKKDRKLLYYLSQNARDSHTQLSKKIGLSKNSVKYRIERLRKLGVISHFATTVNLGAIDQNTFTILLKFNEDIYENKAIVEFFELHPYSDWVITLSGQWDLFVEMIADTINDVHDRVHEIISNFQHSLNTYQIYFSSDVLRVEHLIEDIYKDLELPKITHAPRAKPGQKIDSTDRKILYELNKDSSASYLQIAQRLELTIDIVRYRIKNMKEKGIIVKFFPEIDLQKLGYSKYIYIIKLKNTSAEKMQKLRNSISNNHKVTYAFIDLLSYNLIFSCAFKNTEEIDSLSRNLRKNFDDIIRSQEYLIVKEQVLFNLFPKGLLTE